MRIVIRLFTLGLVLFASPAAAVPMPPGPVEIVNGDGSRVRARAFGDEHLSWIEDLEGRPLVWAAATASWNYAVRGPDGELVPTQHRAGAADLRGVDLPRHVRPSVQKIRKALERRRAAASFAPTPPVGNVPNLVLLVKFANQTTRFAASDFNAVFNGAAGSVKDYYTQVSNGKVTLTSTIKGWIPLKYNDSYYAYNDVANGYPQAMVKEAVAYLQGQGFSFAPFDANKDGYIDAIDVIHSGPGYETNPNPAYIHSHYVPLSTPIVTYDGIRINAYHTEPEVRADNTKISAIGAICHETAHFFGLPDLYDYNFKSAGLGMWSLMSAGSWGGPDFWGTPDGTKPTYPDAWSRYKLGFISPQQVGTSGTGMRLTPAETVGGKALMLNAGMPYGQYFLLENRQKTGYDQYLPGAGLAIYHVDENIQDNNNPAHYLVDLEQADGKRSLNTDPSSDGDASDLYPYSVYGTNATSFTPATTPNSIAYGMTSSLVSVVGITRSGADILFDVSIGASGKAPAGATCSLASQCASGFCADGRCCTTACNAGACDACSRAAGASADGSCEQIPAACDDGNKCTTNDLCQAGVCKGAPLKCPANACQVPGTCNTTTGTCSAATAAANGTACDDGKPCTTADKCQSGVCSGTAQTTCPAPDQCHEAAACNPSTLACGTFASKANGTPCNDGNRCTTNDSCQSGVCGGKPVVCPSADACKEASTCDANTGTCGAQTPRSNGLLCDDANPCTTNDRCTNGTCKGVAGPTTCSPAEPCRNAGVCNASTLECVTSSSKADGTQCDDQDACTTGDACQAGVCTAQAEKVCDPPTGCFELLGCDRATGECRYQQRPDETPCDDGDACTGPGLCAAGVCQASALACPAPGECKTSGGCDRTAGCVYADAPDGTECSAGECRAGACEEEGALSCLGCSAAGAPAPLLWVGLAGLLASLRRRRR